MLRFPFHSLTQRCPLESDYTRRVPASFVFGSITVVSPVSRSGLPRKLPASDT